MRPCFIIAQQNYSTILDRIAHEVGKQFNEPIYHYSAVNLPLADHYFVTHYSMLPNIISQVNPLITPVSCFFTHDKGGLPNYVDAFNLCHAVIAESLEGEELLRSLGVKDSLLHFVPEGGDNEAFRPHQREDNGAILVCGTNYEDGRKNPDLIQKVMDLIPGRQFMIIGRNWDFNRGEIRNNLPYEGYPSVHSKCSIYLSCAKLEGGGPNSLIESMHANLIPVVSDTGNARQYILHGYNGFIFPVDSSAEYVASLIERAYDFRPQDQIPFNDIWKTVSDYTWQNYGLQMKEILTNNYSETLSQGEYAFKQD